MQRPWEGRQDTGASPEGRGEEGSWDKEQKGSWLRAYCLRKKGARLAGPGRQGLGLFHT